MSQFGKILRERREQKQLLLRHVAAKMDMDTALLSKIERGERNARREQVDLLASILDLNAQDLLTRWLADRVYELIEDEEVGMKALMEAATTYKKSQQP